MQLELHSRIVRSDGPVTAPVDDELVMADVDAGKYYAFNSVSTTIWNVIEKPMTVKDLCAELMAAYDVPPERCESEVLQFVNTLHSKGLVKMVA